MEKHNIEVKTNHPLRGTIDIEQLHAFLDDMGRLVFIRDSKVPKTCEINGVKYELEKVKPFTYRTKKAVINNKDGQTS